MCGRYSLKNAIEVKKRFGVLIRPDQNVAPSKKVLVLLKSENLGQKKLKILNLLDKNI